MEEEGERQAHAHWANVLFSRRAGSGLGPLEPSKLLSQAGGIDQAIIG